MLASIVPPPLDISQTKEELDNQIEEYKERTVRQKTEHEEKMIKLEKEQTSFWTLMGKLTEAKSLKVLYIYALFSIVLSFCLHLFLYTVD